ncbi:Tyrosine protein phosphatase 2 [Phytophthora palmivora]|uniref:protein-tyrosine-phosphatase n=1 Tax=Phytophthora palmivora TaxID=4796 RepID=A0A2P4XRV7_9STRA|nr:Tyrosine protein phosphatase 2 [Phytophthora palmivora]
MEPSTDQVTLQLQEEPEPSVTKFACKKCRCVLFTSEQLALHEPEQHQISARRKLKDLKHHVGTNVECSSYFLEETLSWMDEALLAEGKIHCPSAKCQARLGALQWSGSQCSCGTWVTPSIKITKSRVDAVVKQTNLNIVHGVVLPSASEAYAAETLQ